MRIAITDDDQSIIDSVHELLQTYVRDHGIPADFSLFKTPQEFMDSLEDGASQYSMVVMDVYFDGETLTGVDAIRRLREVDRRCHVIFLTSSADHMQDAFRVHAYSYVMKEDLKTMLPEVLDDLLSTMPVKRSITLTSGKQTIMLPIEEIMCIQTDAHYLMIHDTSSKDHRIRMTFSEITRKLEQSKEFLLINKGILVNMDHVKDIEDKNAILTDGTSLPVRMRGYAAIVREWHDYNFDKLRAERI